MAVWSVDLTAKIKEVMKVVLMVELMVAVMAVWKVVHWVALMESLLVE